MEIIGLRDLKPDPQNARKHTRRNVGMIADDLQEVGAARSIVIDTESDGLNEVMISFVGSSTRQKG